MRVLPFTIPKPEAATLVYQVDAGRQFYDKLHQHREIQLSLILRGRGSYIIGDQLGTFAAGDLFMLGEQVPHVFQNQGEEEEVEMHSIFFLREAFGPSFFELPELSKSKKLMEASKNGLHFFDRRKKLCTHFEQVEAAKGIARLGSFLHLLAQLSKMKHQVIAPSLPLKLLDEQEGKRMRQIMDYSFKHFDKPLSIDEMAEIANLSPNAFCRYFKQKTNKTFVAFLTEIRLARVCRRLIDQPEMSIAEIAFSSGFQNLTNFNRRFKKAKGLTPTQYRAQNKKDILSNALVNLVS